MVNITTIITCHESSNIKLLVIFHGSRQGLFCLSTIKGKRILSSGPYPFILGKELCLVCTIGPEDTVTEDTSHELVTREPKVVV